MSHHVYCQISNGGCRVVCSTSQPTVQIRQQQQQSWEPLSEAVLKPPGVRVQLVKLLFDGCGQLLHFRCLSNVTAKFDKSREKPEVQHWYMSETWQSCFHVIGKYKVTPNTSIFKEHITHAWSTLYSKIPCHFTPSNTCGPWNEKKLAKIANGIKSKLATTTHLPYPYRTLQAVPKQMKDGGY